jgi:hypothetical protein
MAIAATDLIWRLSGGDTNTDPVVHALVWPLKFQLTHKKV